MNYDARNHELQIKGISVFTVHNTFQTKLSSSGEYHTIYERNVKCTFVVVKDTAVMHRGALHERDGLTFG